MKKEIQHQLQKHKALFSVGIVCMLFISCSDAADNDACLPEGEFPLTFTTRVETAVAQRASTENTWDGNEKVAIQVGSKVKQYVAGTDGKLVAASGVTPFYWTTEEDIIVNAWYPFAETKPMVTVEADQSTETAFQGSDYLEADNAQVAFSNPTLNFYHRTAKVSVKLIAGAGVTLEDATVQFVNQTNVKEGTTVTPFVTAPDGGGDFIYTALLAPQQMQGLAFIKIGTNIKDYYYTPKEIADANLEAGKRYTYLITVNNKSEKEELTVSLISSETWAQEGEDIPVVSQIISARDLKICDYYYSDGTWSDGGYRKYRDGTSILLDVKPVLTNPETLLERKVVGIVFCAGRQADDTSDYSRSLTVGAPCVGSNHIHGYVLALTDIGKMVWEVGEATVLGKQLGTSVSMTDWNGYHNQTAFHTYLAKTPTVAITDFPALNQSEKYGTSAENNNYAAPSQSSGWFLPSAGQLKYIYDQQAHLIQQLTNLKTVLNDNNIGWLIVNQQYWSSSESTAPKFSYTMDLNTQHVESRQRNNVFNVRSICAF